MTDMPLPPTPFQVKLFPPNDAGYETWAARDHPTNFEKAMNEWFTTLARDGENEYDIRQILQLKGGGILVFYEVTPLGSRELPCGRVCDTCGTSLYLQHKCTRCDAD